MVKRRVGPGNAARTCARKSVRRVDVYVKTMKKMPKMAPCGDGWFRFECSVPRRAIFGELARRFNHGFYFPNVADAWPKCESG